MGKRTPRIEIKVVMPTGTMAYRHALGDEIAKSHGGGISAGPSENDFTVACRAILDLVGVTKLVKEELAKSGELPSATARIELGAEEYANLHGNEMYEVSALKRAYLAGANKGLEVAP